MHRSRSQTSSTDNCVIKFASLLYQLLNRVIDVTDPCMVDALLQPAPVVHRAQITRVKGLKVLLHVLVHQVFVNKTQRKLILRYLMQLY